MADPLSDPHFLSYLLTGNVDDLQKYLDPFAEQRILMQRSNSYYLSYLLTGDLDDLQESVRCAQTVFDGTRPDSPQMIYIESSLAKSLARRFLHTRQLEDVQNAIEKFQHVLRLMENDHPRRQTCIDYLIFCNLLIGRTLEGSVEEDDLHVSLPSVSRVSILLHSQSCENEKVYGHFWTDLPGCNPSTSEFRLKIEAVSPKFGEDEEVYDYYMFKIDECRGESPLKQSMEELDSEIRLHRQALKIFSSPPADSKKISTILVSLGRCLRQRFSLHSNSKEDLDGAIDCFSQALKLPMQSSMLVDCLFLASNAFTTRFRSLGRREDLENAVDYAKQGITYCDSPVMQNALGSTLPSKLETAAGALFARYSATGDVNDLNTAVQLSLRAVNIAERDGLAILPALLSDFALRLKRLFGLTGQSTYLRLALESSQRAVDLLHLYDGDRHRFYSLIALSDLETFLGMFYQDVEMSERGHTHLLEAISAASGGLGSNGGVEYDLVLTIGEQLFSTYRWDETIKLMRELINRPEQIYSPERCYRLLGRSLFFKWKETHEPAILDEAIVIADLWTDLEDAKLDGSIVAQLLLGQCLYHRYKITKNDNDLQNSQAALLKGFQMAGGIPHARIMAGMDALNILCDLAQWENALNLTQQVVELIVIGNGRFLNPTDKQTWLRDVFEQIPTFTAIALQAGSDVYNVIDLFETCRGSILGHMIDNRTDLDHLKRVAPHEAESFVALRDEINAGIVSSAGMNARVEEISRRGRAEEEIRGLLEKIRKLEGFDRFLLGPARTELEAATAQGPIVIVNITSIRSDAIIVTGAGCVLLPLPELSYSKVEEYQEVDPVDFSDLVNLGKQNRKYLQLLAWLWDKCVKLILKKLDELLPGTAKFHVWWLGMGIASSLPFHAAGIYTGRLRESALFRVISSYTPSLKFLLHGRRRLTKMSSDPSVQRLPSKPEMFFVTMPTTPGNADDLEGVVHEAEIVQKIVGNSFSFQDSRQPSAREVMKGMERCEIVHFACHGQSILTEPLRSHLLLQTTSPDSTTPRIDELTVGDVATLNLSQGKLAFLSACSTAENRNKRFWDEALHLAAGFQVAGYLHTVGNLWPANDRVSVLIVEKFYQHLLEAGEFGDGENIAKALNEALTDVLDKTARQPLTWAQFVHFGV